MSNTVRVAPGETPASRQLSRDARRESWTRGQLNAELRARGSTNLSAAEYRDVMSGASNIVF